MAADPIKAAQDLAGQTYSTAQDRTTAGKKALLDQLATQGTYQNTINSAAVQQAAPQPVATKPGDNARLTDMSHQGADQYAAIGQAATAAAAALAAHQEQQRQSAASTYFDQVNAALPVEQSRAQSEAGQIYADLIAKREAQAAAAKQQQLQLQMQQESLAGAREQRAFEQQQRSQGKGIADLDPAERYALQQQMEDDSLSSVVGSYDPSTGLYSGAYALKTGALSQRGKAIQWMTEHPEASISDAASKFGVHGAADMQSLQDGINAYYTALEKANYYGNFGGQRPSNLNNSAGVHGVLGGLLGQAGF